MVAAIRNIELALGNGHKVPSPSESKNKDIARKSIHLKTDLPAGHILQAEDLVMKRPGNGISPMRMYEVIGKKTTPVFASRTSTTTKRLGMKIGVLTSSRADYGIYLPLLKELKNDSFFKTEVIAFGTHLSQAHGYTLKQIEQDGFDVPVKVDTMPEGDTPQHISEAMGKTISAF